MPEINDVLETTIDDIDLTDATDIVEATTITPPSTNGHTKPVKLPHNKKSVVDKVEKKSKPVTKPVKEPQPKAAERVTQPKYVRPAMEMLTRDFETFLATLTINKKHLEHLEFKCGKIIYGLKNDKGKDFRVIAIKARGKHKSVEGKSRCIYYFGTTKDMTKQLKDLPGIKNSKFTLGSVQSKHAVELVLDKVTFTEIFNQNIDKVMDTLKKISHITIEQKQEQFTQQSKKEIEE
jgi:hypothetical protein